MRLHCVTWQPQMHGIQLFNSKLLLRHIMQRL
jgi:hypothetical protein